jgi:hypothetical protein
VEFVVVLYLQLWFNVICLQWNLLGSYVYSCDLMLCVNSEMFYSLLNWVLCLRLWFNITTHTLRSSLQFVFRLFTTSSSSEDWTMKSRIYKKKIDSLYLLKGVLEDNNTLLKRVLSIAYKWRKMVLAIIRCFQVDYCFTVVSYDDLECYLIYLNDGWRSLIELL